MAVAVRARDKGTLGVFPYDGLSCVDGQRDVRGLPRTDGGSLGRGHYRGLRRNGDVESPRLYRVARTDLTHNGNLRLDGCGPVVRRSGPRRKHVSPARTQSNPIVVVRPCPNNALHHWEIDFSHRILRTQIHVQDFDRGYPGQNGDLNDSGVARTVHVLVRDCVGHRARRGAVVVPHIHNFRGVVRPRASRNSRSFNGRRPNNRVAGIGRQLNVQRFA